MERLTETIADGMRLVAPGDNPSLDPATVKRHTDDAARSHLLGEVRGNEVVEGPVESGDVGNDAGDGIVNRQAPTADLKSDSRDRLSHVNSGSSRPK